MKAIKQIWRRIFFSHMNEIVNLGATRSLESTDLPQLPEILDPQHTVLDESRIDWSSGPQLLKTVLLTSKHLWILSLVLYLSSAALNLSGPVLVNQFIKHLQAGVTDSGSMVKTLLFGLCIGISGILSGIFMQHYFNRNLRLIQIIVNILNTRIFKHSLRLSKSAREKTAIGDIVNHMSSDSDSVSEIGAAFNDLVYCTVMITGAIGLLFYYIGNTAWVAVGLLAILVPISRKVSQEFTRFDEDLMKYRDRRVSLMSQLLSAIRLVKYFAWEKSVRDEVNVIRAEELDSRKKIARAELMVTLIYVSIGTIVLFSVLAVYSLRGGTLDPALIFTCVSLFGLLEDPFAFITRVISHYIGAKVGAQRICNFLKLPASEDSSGNLSEDPQPVGFKMKDFSVLLGDSKYPALKNLNLDVKPGASLAVVGPVGSGKSTFINALLGEEPPSHGVLEMKKCRIGYVPQEAFILNGSLRDNLSFGLTNISDEELKRALEISGLWQDVQQLNGGLNTEIGEKGVNLSGGQRQRLSLARAIIHRPQLVILDDPLSAVDPQTEDYLAQHLLFGEWKHVTKVVITHRLNHLEKFDQIIFIEKGIIKGQGNFSELYQNCQEFRAYVDEFANGHKGAHVAALEPEKREVPSVANGDANRITEDEDRQFGAVSGRVYWDYILSLGGENLKWRPAIIFMLFAAAASGTVFPLLQKSWLALMSNTQAGAPSIFSGSFLEAWAKVPLTGIYIYGLLGLLVLAGALCADLYWLRRGLIAGKNIHDNMLRSILGASIRFFDSTPVGRVLQRFSRDMEAIDVQLQWSFETSMKCFAQVLVTLTLICITLPAVILFIGPVLLIYYRVQKLYRTSAREVKRLDSIARSPRYAHFKETLQGLVVIRAYGKNEWFLQEFFNRLKHSQQMFYGHFMVNRWFSTRIPVLGGLVSIGTTFAIVFSVKGGALSPGLAGLLTVYSLSFWGVLNWGIRIWAEVEAKMTSMERVKFYSKLPQESLTLKKAMHEPNWPIRGEIEFSNAVVRYAPHLPQILKGLSFHVQGGQKVGIIGRTGSGKSTLFQSLYRFIELESGSILIDGVDIASIPLPKLGKALAIIPQDPTLFMGTLRMNLDRFNEFSDRELWQVLERTCLSEFVKSLPKGLNTDLSENGANFSQGQRQLICLARALLLKAKVIILDEATASVDVKTDSQVQMIIRESCNGITMLIIAHRLGTVRDCDQVLEIAEGRLRRVILPKRAMAESLEAFAGK